MDPSITDVASYLAARIPTGADDEDRAVEDWRETLYNARRTRSLRIVASLVDRCAPDDPEASELCRQLLPPRG